MIRGRGSHPVSKDNSPDDCSDHADHREQDATDYLFASGTNTRRLLDAALDERRGEAGELRPAVAFRQFLDGMDEFWRSPIGQQRHAARQAAEAELQAWLADQPGVVVHSHGGYAPEQWKGDVDGHSFYFRERDTDWDIEIDLRPSGRFMRVVDGTNDDGTTRYRQDEIVVGDVIATGTTAAEGYGESPRERAAFIVTTIRDHLVRRRGS